MAVATGYSGMVKRGLVFSMDIGDTVNSYKGEPTINYIWHQNPRIDSSYTSYMPEQGNGTITQNHPGAIRVYNQDGGDISYYVNGGVGDWTNARHAYWIFDNALQRPVVRMYNENGSWQSKYFNPSIGSFNAIGVYAGTQYTLSWLQYVENLDRGAHVGFYSNSNIHGYNNFWDGLQNGYNTKPYTWQRVSVTFTAQDNGQLGNYQGAYMYGHAVGSGELRIADVQLEVKSFPSAFCNQYERAAHSSESIASLRKYPDNTVAMDVSSCSFINGKPYFDGTNDFIDIDWNGILQGSGPFTIESITNKVSGSYGAIIGNYGPGSDELWWSTAGLYLRGNCYHSSYSSSMAGWHHSAVTRDGAGNCKLYRDGVLVNTAYLPHSIAANQFNWRIGADVNGAGEPLTGEIPVINIHDVELTAGEIKKNYLRYKTRFNLP